MSLKPNFAGRDLYGGANALLSMPSVSGSSDTGSSGSGFSIMPYLNAATSILGSLDAGPFSSSINFDDDGRMQVVPTWWDENINKGRLNQLKAQAQAYNNSLDQYDQQYQLQKDAFEFNKDLSNRQQDLAEESYYNGTINQAKQLSQLGINPASQGGSISGATMSGGSSIQSGSASAGNTNTPETGGMNLEALSVLASISAKQSELQIAKYNAETSRISANAGAENALASAENIKVMTDFFKTHGYLASPYAGTPTSVNTDRAFKIGSTIVSMLIGYFLGKGKKPPKDDSGSGTPHAVPKGTGKVIDAEWEEAPENSDLPLIVKAAQNDSVDEYVFDGTLGIGDITDALSYILDETNKAANKSADVARNRDLLKSLFKGASTGDVALGSSLALQMINAALQAAM